MTRARTRWMAGFLGLWGAALLASPAFSEPPPEEEGWQFRIAPYLWASGMKGSLIQDGVRTPIDVGFGDIVSKLEFGLMGSFDARHDRIIILADALGMQLSEDGNNAIQINPGPGPGLSTELKFDVDVTTVMAQAAAGYRVLRQPMDPLFGGAESELDVDLFAGGRFWWVRNKGKVNLGGMNLRFDEDTWWIDPVVGTRVNVPLSNRFSVGAIGTIGGFDIGSASQWAWSGSGLLGYQVSESWLLAIGYRAMGFQRAATTATTNLTLYGPILGAIYHF